MKKLLVDTSFIVPLFRLNDSLRERALEHNDLLEEECYISNLVVNEVLTILAMRTKDIELVKRAYEFMVDRFYIIEEYELENFNDKVFDLFYNVNNNHYNLSFVDSSLVVLAKLFKLDLVTFDEGFKKIDGLKVYL